MRSIDEDVGRRIAHLRNEERWSQAAFAEKLGIDQAAISRYETGQVAVPLFRLVQMARVLRVSIPELLQLQSDDALRDSAVERLVMMVGRCSTAEIDLVMNVGIAAVNHVRKVNGR